MSILKKHRRCGNIRIFIQEKGLYVTQITEDGDLAVLSGSNQFSVSDKVIRGGVKIQKRDLETGDTKPQGSATLKDTAFDIISLNDNEVLVEGKLYKKNEVVKTIHTDIEGIASTSADLLPYGKFRIVESEAPDGYLTDGAKPIDFAITENGKIVDLTDEAHSIYNQIKRGDIEGVKIGAGTHKRLADVPFRITSKTTGESHVVVTDDNGQFSTSADWTSHKHNTNAGKTSEDGVWFGTSEPDDSKGALPYDTYIIEELRSDGNKGFELIPPFEIVVSRNNLVIDLGTLTDEYEKEISIHTTATSKDGEKTILAGKEVTIVDTVKLDGLTKGTKYQLKGWQMLKEENAELVIGGKRVENDYTFIADDEAMKVEIAYTFNASALGGKNLVTFEELYDLSNPDEPVKVAEHKDIEDDGQTVLITERIIKIHTTATDKDGNKELEAGKEVTIIDTVTLEGLEVGTQYKLVGWQMLKKENTELLINGKRVESDYTFTADSETIVRNYRKELKRRRNKEISYCELPEIVVEKLAVWDEYESDYTAFDVCGIEVRVLDDDLAEAIKYLPVKDREILLMYFFLDMSDTEIGKKLKINRSTSFRSRKHSLEEIKKKLKENINDE